MKQRAQFLFYIIAFLLLYGLNWLLERFQEHILFPFMNLLDDAMKHSVDQVEEKAGAWLTKTQKRP